MKCPKCNFISFDHNQTCPKCGNDLSHERDLMNFPSYKPKPLSLLGVLTGDGETPADDTRMGQSEASGAQGSDAQELLISLDSLSDEGQEPIQFEPGPSVTGSQIEMDKGAEAVVDELAISLDDFSDEDHEPIRFEPEPSVTIGEMKTEGKGPGADEELTISLDDLSDGAPELVLFDPETEAVMSEKEIEGKAVFEPGAVISEEAGREAVGFWESEALEPRMADIQLDDASVRYGATSHNEKEAPGKGEETEPGPLEWELEPLELDMEVEDPDKKTP
ncbi:MAG: hypothetical protein QG552_2468 [Thermodesulfobacteriota bacterium]|nr:hypothetical protein [Thermodesulfobacteriota bacterium]